MGARPILALAIAGFPDELPAEYVRAILQGGADKVAEAGAVVAGGHTVVDQEPKYGLCVTGLVDPARITPKANAQVGDRLLLTKPLGTGLITTAAKRHAAGQSHLDAAIASMLTLNRRAAELAAMVEIHSATDITGFGLLGHAAEIARHSAVGLRIMADALPLLPGALDYARAGMAAGGLGRNRDFLERDGYVQIDDRVDPALRLLLYDPQTSGGLLFMLPAAATESLQAACEAAGQPCWHIGEVIAEPGILVE